MTLNYTNFVREVDSLKNFNVKTRKSNDNQL